MYRRHAAELRSLMLGPLHANVVAKKKRLTEDSFNVFRKRRDYGDFLVSSNPDLMMYHLATGADQAFAAYDGHIRRNTLKLTEEMIERARQKAGRNLDWWLKVSERHEQALSQVVREAAMVGAKLAMSGEAIGLFRSMAPSPSKMMKQAEESTNFSMFFNGLVGFINQVEDDIDDYVLPSFVDDLR